MLDSATDCGGGIFQNPAVAFIFADQGESCYIANALNADITCVNSFPAELAVGPRFVTPMQSFTSKKGTLPPRYSRDMFEEQKPTMLHPSAGSEVVGQGFIAEAVETRKRFHHWTESVVKPLAPTGQHAGIHSVFFRDAFFMGAAALVLPVAGMLVTLGSIAVRSVRGGKLSLPW